MIINYYSLDIHWISDGWDGDLMGVWMFPKSWGPPNHPVMD